MAEARVTVAQIAAACGVSERTVHDWTKRPGWPAGVRSGLGGALTFDVAQLPERIDLKGRRVAVRGPVFDLLVKETLKAAAAAALPAAPVSSSSSAPVPSPAGALPAAPAAAGLSLPKRRPVPAETANHRQRIVRDARLGICNAVRDAAERHGISEARAVAAWLEGLRRGEMPMAQMLWCALANDKNGMRWEVSVTAGGPVGVPIAGQDIAAFAAQLSARSIQRWLAERRAGGDDALLPWRPQKDMRVPPWAGVFLSEMQRPQKPTLAAAWRRMAKRLEEAGWQAHRGAGVCREGFYPSYHAVRRWYLEKYSRLDAQRGRRTGSAINPYKFCHKRSSAGMWPLLEVHSDGWNTKFTAPHPVSGKFVTFEVWHAHDVATRKAYVHERSIGLSENTTVILGSLYAVAAEDGVMTVWQTDNTGSVKNDRVEFDPCSSIAARLGITIVHNIAGNSQANGIAENFNKYLDERSKELATYQGRAMDGLTAKRVLKITQKLVRAQAAGDSEEALRLRAEAARTGCGLVFGSYAEAVAWVKQVTAEFNDRPHKSLPRIVGADGRKRHMSPNEMMAKFIAEGWQREPLSGDELADAFRVHERKTIRRGVVSVMGQDYHAPGMDDMNNEEVLVAYDIDNGRRVFVKRLDGTPLFEAEFYNTRHYRPMDFYEIALEKRADAQVKRLGKKIADIEAQRPGTLIEERVVEVIPAQMAERVVIGEERLDAADVTPMPMQKARPNLLHLDDPALIRWLAAHPEDWNDHLRRYLDEQAEKIEAVANLIDEYDLWGELAGFERAAVSGN